jgi:hypothetical protein
MIHLPVLGIIYYGATINGSGVYIKLDVWEEKILYFLKSFDLTTLKMVKKV